MPFLSDTALRQVSGRVKHFLQTRCPASQPKNSANRTGGRFCFAASHHFAQTGKSFIALNTPRPRFFLTIVVGLDEELASFLDALASLEEAFGTH